MPSLSFLTASGGSMLLPLGLISGFVLAAINYLVVKMAVSWGTGLRNPWATVLVMMLYAVRLPVLAVVLNAVFRSGGLSLTIATVVGFSAWQIVLIIKSFFASQ